MGKNCNAFQYYLMSWPNYSGEPKLGTLTYAGSKFDGFHEEFLPPGVHALGNNAPGVTWNKIAYGKTQFEAIVKKTNIWENRKELLCSLIDLLGNREKYMQLIYILKLFLN